MLFDDGFEVQFFHRFETDSFSDPTLSEPRQPLLQASGPLQNGGARLAFIGGQAPEVADDAAGLREWHWGSGLGRLDHLQELGGGLGARLLGWLVEEFLYDRPTSPDAGSTDKDSITLASETIVVTGNYLSEPEYDPSTDGSEGDGQPDGSHYGDYNDSTPYETGGNTCDCAGMTEAQKREQAIDAAVAKVREEILRQANQNAEYGSLIWIDKNGAVHYTPLTQPTGYQAAFNLTTLPRNLDGTPDYSGVVAIVHSHPEYNVHPETGQIVPYYDPERPERLLTPTSLADWGGTQSDWVSYDDYTGRIVADGGNVSSLAFYIVGFGKEGLVINQFGWEDRETESLADGESVDANTEACTC